MKEEAPKERFKKWMYTRKGGVYKDLKMKYYTDGEPYFAHFGAEMPLRDFLAREQDLTTT